MVSNFLLYTVVLIHFGRSKSAALHSLGACERCGALRCRYVAERPWAGLRPIQVIMRKSQGSSLMFPEVILFTQHFLCNMCPDVIMGMTSAWCDIIACV